ncbi:MAG TPA: hypothetical protein VM406_01745, partial [Noviherbaspirillum sp.]|nr:hypothetical protein [Noviherbaspirillum sp.]
LSPHVMPLVEGIVEWVAANKELIRAEVGAWIRDVAASIKGWLASGGMDRLKAGIESLVSGIGSFVNAMGGMRNVMIAFGVLIALGPAASIAQLAAVFVQIGTYVAPLVVKSLLVIGAAFKSVALALLTNPIGLVVTGIALAAGLLIYNWDKIGPWFASLWTNVQGYFRGAWEGIKTLLSWSPLGLVMKTWEPLVSWFSGLWDRVKGFIEPIVSAGKAVGGWFGGGKQAQQSGGLAGGRSPLVAAGGLASQANVSGEMRVRFENAPPGMRVDQGKTNQSALAFNPDVGYRMAAY